MFLFATLELKMLTTTPKLLTKIKLKTYKNISLLLYFILKYSYLNFIKKIIIFHYLISKKYIIKYIKNGKKRKKNKKKATKRIRI